MYVNETDLQIGDFFLPNVSTNAAFKKTFFNMLIIPDIIGSKWNDLLETITPIGINHFKLV